MKPHTKFEKIINAFCDRIGKTPKEWRFMFDGQKLTKNDTPDTFEMEDGDTIDVMTEQVGGSKF